ncbi:carbohydrate ABC transporter membrane protein 2 (CUT1 family) [Hungatella effluvii]|uniref:Carbohydrate ABC transporter membrane protein 2 (CUT1 family) n=1 Tax=Hungatella effluvii TaxID=1096246 RepID=A0A2V3XXZ7_9FIRM|nr:carbohydrate ABC transporter permease [Hungatella effluvii]PXX49218.1 carbohydrate ABC transporter membrane protein 2 (CUT1 family) [Hungatella effluvii]
MSKDIRVRNKMIRNILFYITVCLLVLLTVFPFLWMVSTSLKYDTQVFTNPIQWIPKPVNWNNYIRVWEEVPFLLFYRNTAVVSVFGTALQVFCCSLAAYAFSKLRFTGKNVLFGLFLATMMVPWHTIMLPQYVIMGKLKMLDKLSTLIMMQAFSAFGIFLMRQFFMGIPDELREAAKVDGAGEWIIFIQIIMPQAKAGMAALTIFTFVGQWNDYISPLIYLNSPEKYTIQLGLKMFAGAYTMEYALTMAGTLCAMIPIFVVYLFFEKQITQGIAFAGLKG